MISTPVLISMFVPIIFSFLLFIGLILYVKKKHGLYVKPLIVGSIGFIVITQILEKALHLLVVTNFPNYAEHPWWFGLYGGMAAGVFEEVGRFLLFVWLLKKYRDYRSGLSFGVGWGGIEAVVLTLMIVVPNIIFAFAMNAGTFDATIAKQLPVEQVTVIKDSLLTQGVSFYLFACLERFFAVFMQIALTLFVLLAVIQKRFIYVIYAILIHAAIDFPIVFFQTGHIKSIWIVELYIAVIGIASIFFIKKLKSEINHSVPAA